jgi:hypothetical protein
MRVFIPCHTPLTPPTSSSHSHLPKPKHPPLMLSLPRMLSLTHHAHPHLTCMLIYAMLFLVHVNLGMHILSRLPHYVIFQTHTFSHSSITLTPSLLPRNSLPLYSHALRLLHISQVDSLSLNSCNSCDCLIWLTSCAFIFLEMEIHPHGYILDGLHCLLVRFSVAAAVILQPFLSLYSFFHILAASFMY